MSTNTNKYKIEIDYSRDELFDILGMTRLRDSYMKPEEKSPQDRLAFVSAMFASNQEHAQRMYDYASKHWVSYATPILAFGKDKKGMPISCFLSYIDDTASGLVNTWAEVAHLSMLGGGVGVGVGIRSADKKSVGVMPHLKTYDASSLAYRQGETRRGSYAAYLNIDHPDIMMFTEMRKPTGDQNMKCINLHHGINVTDKFMQIIENCMKDDKFDDSWELKDPKDGSVKEVVSAKRLWERLIEMRLTTGEPYLHFIDTSNRHLPETQKALGLSVKQSNICTEITLATDYDRTAVCCLSSFNLVHFDSYKNNYQFFRDVMEFLDNVLTYFIENAPDEIKRAKYSAMRERAIGLGALGFHTMLQNKGIAFESVMAKSVNIKIFKTIREHLDRGNLELGAERGSPPDMEGTGKRFSHTTAIAPNASSSIIMGNISPSIEPLRANCYRQDTMSGSYLHKNQNLDKLIKEKCAADPSLKYDEIWNKIMNDDGSVQKMDIFDENEKAIYRTALEIDQRWVIEHAADRQPEIDQAQSVNVFFRPTAHIKYLHAVHYSAWKQGLKSVYYCRSDKIRKADKVSQSIERNIIAELDMTKLVEGDECLSCQG